MLNRSFSALRWVLVAAVLALSACVYRINIQQGNFLDPKAVDQLAPGMTRSQVRFLLGSPLVPSAFDPDRWDYVYYFKRGRLRQPQQRQVTVFFEEDLVSRIAKSDTDERGKAKSAARVEAEEIQKSADAHARAAAGEQKHGTPASEAKPPQAPDTSSPPAAPGNPPGNPPVDRSPDAPEAPPETSPPG